MTKRCPDCGSRMRLLDMTWWICLGCYYELTRHRTAQMGLMAQVPEAR